jgi:Bacterial membrane protein YfhO
VRPTNALRCRESPEASRWEVQATSTSSHVKIKSAPPASSTELQARRSDQDVSTLPMSQQPDYRRGVASRIASLLNRPHVLILLFLVALRLNLFSGETALPLLMAGVMPNGPYQYDGQRLEFDTTVDYTGALDAEFAWSAYFVASIRKGEFPFWNPYQGLGQPLLANYVSGVLYPINWLHIVIPPAWWDLVFLLNTGLAAISVYLLCRVLLLSRPASLVAAVAVLTSGFIAAFLPVRSIVSSIVWYPFLLYAIERAFREPAWKSATWSLFIGTYCLATAGHPEPALMILAAVCAYVVLRKLLDRGLSWSDIFWVVAPMFAGGLVAAPLWLNFADYLFQDGAAVPHTPDLGVTHFPWWSVPSLVFPRLYGPLNTAGTFDRAGWFSAMVIALALAGVVALVRQRDPRRSGSVAVALITAVTAAKLYGVPGINDVGRLPLLREFLFDYGSGLLMIGICILCGVGFDYLRREPSRNVVGWMLMLWLSLAGVLAAILVAIQKNDAILASASRAHHLVTAMCFGLFWAIAAPLGLFIAAGAATGRQAAMLFVTVAAIVLQGWASIPSGTGRHYLAANILAALLFTCVLLIRARSVRLSRKVALAAPIVVVAALSTTVSRYAPQLPSRYDPLVAAPYVNRLQTLSGTPRVYALDGILFPNFGAALAIHSVTNIENLVPTQGAAFISTYLDPGAHPARFFGVNHVRYAGSPSAIDAFAQRKRYWDFIGVKYVLSHTADVLGSGVELEARPADSSADITWWVNASASPRAFLATDLLSVPDWQSGLARLADTQNLMQTVYLEASQANTCSTVPSESPATEGPPGALVSLTATANSVDVRYRANTQGVLTLTDTFMRGWRATLDGREVPVLRVDGVFRGVCIPEPGLHHVRFTYRPALWSWSLGLAIGGFLMVVSVETARHVAKRRQVSRIGTVSSVGRRRWRYPLT